MLALYRDYNNLTETESSTRYLPLVYAHLMLSSLNFSRAWIYGLVVTVVVIKVAIIAACCYRRRRAQLVVVRRGEE